MHYQFDFSSVLSGENLALLLSGVETTLMLFVVCWVIAFALAIVLASLARVHFWPARAVARAFIEYHRNVPLLVQLLFWYFAIPQLFPAPVSKAINSWNAEFFYAMVALSLYSASYISENIRSGLRAIPKTQFEAAEAMGFSHFRTMRYIIMPQAGRHALPSLIGDTIGLFKGTAIAGVIGVGELTYQVEQIEQSTFRVFEIFIVASVIYLAVTIPLMLLGEYAGDRLKQQVAR